jgi:hypothetical protein
MKMGSIRMTKSVTRLTATTAAAAVLVLLAGCSAAEPEGAAPPPPPAAAYQPAPPPVELAGAPPAAANSGFAGGPPVAVSASMAPIANPMDMPAAERHRIYGYKYDRAPRRAAAPAYRPAPSPVRAAQAPAAPRPAAPLAKAPAAKPATVAPAKPAVTTKPLAKAAPTATPVAKPVVPADAKAAPIGVALSAPVAAASSLKIADVISTGQPGAVVLTLPQNLLDLIKQQAAKVGLTRAARTTDVSATLTGDGYTITPNGPQTARLKSGEAPAFTWQVAPVAGVEQSPLRAKVEAILRGERNPRAFSLTALEQAVKVVFPEPPKTGFFSGLDLGKLNIGGLKLPDYGEVDVPGIGKAPSRTLIGGGLLLAAAILLLALWRRAVEAKARAARRRKFRTMTDYGAEPAYEQPAATVYAEPETTYAEPVATTVYPAPQPVEVVHEAHHESAAQDEAPAHTAEDDKANWPWRKDEETTKQPENA